MRRTLFYFSTVFFLVGYCCSTRAQDDPAYYRKTLESLQNKVPLTYNENVRSFIDVYSSSQKKRFAQLLGLSKYYFPIFEKVFKERGVPDELKYISVIESSLNPNAVSKAEATGPWQFLNEVGKKYGLAVNDSIDERRDPSMACNAAASYLLDSYAFYGNDWLLAIASYNCGRNSIKWAMEDSGGKTDYWAIRKFLPRETQNYVPAFIATVYMMNNYRRYGISPIEPDFITETETLLAGTHISLDDIAKAGNLNPYIVYTLNPLYKKKMVNGSKSSPKPIIIPVLPTYTYNAICRIAGAPERIIPVYAAAPPPKPSYMVLYTVQEGDTLDSIAAKFKGLSPENIMKTNKLIYPVVKAGSSLTIMVVE